MRSSMVFGLGLVYFVDCDHERHASGAGVVNRLDGLRHYAVVRRHHKDHDIRRFGTAGTHHREGLVAGRI